MFNYLQKALFVTLFLLAGGVMNAQQNVLSIAAVQNNSSSSNIPHYVEFKEGSEIELSNFEAWLKRKYQLPENAGLLQLDKTEDDLGLTHYRYIQTYDGVSIEHSMLILHVRNGMVKSFNGTLADYPKVSTTVSLSSNDAISLAILNVPAQRYLWQAEGEDNTSPKPQGYYDNNELYPEAEKVIIATGEGFDGLKLAYKVNVVAVEPFEAKVVYLDAQTGEVIKTEAGAHDADTQASGQTVFSGHQNFMTSKNSQGQYVLNESGRGKGIETRDLREQVTDQQVNGNFTSYEITNTSTNWSNIASSKKEGLDAHWGAEMTYDYFYQVHGRSSIDGNGQILKSYINLSYQGINAFWIPGKDIMIYAPGLVFPDVTSHEIGHGLTSKTGNLVYQGESGALNESFSDIFGNTVEQWARPNKYDWKLGEDLGANQHLRDMANPKTKGDPDTYKGTNWASTSGGDNGGVHTNSGVQNFWYVVLVDGKSGTNDNGDSYNVIGIGLEKASKIAFRNLTVYMTPNSDYADARQFAIKSAEDLFGKCSPEVIACTNAWHAVGVGAKHQSQSSDADFVASKTEGCQVPSEISFMSTGMGGTSYTWDFGDGQTGNTNNPTHTYTQEGVYTVSLSVSGDCGSDSEAKVDYIDINLNNPCIEDMIDGRKTVTSCDGILYDNGGANANYDNEKEYYVTIAPPGASKIEVKFTEFEVEPGDGSGNQTCNYDRVNLYDGADENATVLGTYCNNSKPTLNSSISSTGSDMTVHLHADQLENLAGFRLEWTCEMPVLLDVDFDVSKTNVKNCEDVTYTANVTGGTVGTYSWDFGSGASPATASGIGPHTVKYLTTGDKTVSLTADGETETKTNYITVSTNAANAPTVSIMIAGNPTCEGNQVHFVVNETNQGGQPNYEWFVNNQSVFNGKNFTSNTLNDGDKVKVILVSNDECALPKEVTSAEIIINLSDEVVPVIQISANKTTICEGEQISFSSTIINGGNNPDVKWYVGTTVQGTNLDLDISTLVSGDVITASVLSGESCASTSEVQSNAISIAVTDKVIPAVGISSSTTSICSGEEVDFSITTQSNEGNNPLYKWLVNGNSAGTNTTLSLTSLSDGDVVKLELISSETCITATEVVSNEVSMSVMTPIDPSVNIALTNEVFPVCKNTTIVFDATVTNGGANAAIDWFINGIQIGQGNSFTIDNPVDGTFINAKLYSSLSCISNEEVSSNIIFAEVEICAGIKGALNEEDYEIFPNPTSSTINVRGEAIDLVTVVNSIGETVKSYKVEGNEVEVNISNLSSGIYLIKINANNKQLVKKVYKN